jgi:hypothetical protein
MRPSQHVCLGARSGRNEIFAAAAVSAYIDLGSQRWRRSERQVAVCVTAYVDFGTEMRRRSKSHLACNILLYVQLRAEARRQNKPHLAGAILPDVQLDARSWKSKSHLAEGSYGSPFVCYSQKWFRQANSGGSAVCRKYRSQFVCFGRKVLA